MAFKGRDRRKSNRFDTELKIDFRVTFDIETKIKYKVLEKDKSKFSGETYSAVGCNISLEGIGFVSVNELKIGDSLLMDVFIPSVKNPVLMEGRVRWCKPLKAKEGYRIGVKVIKVNGELVERSIMLDPVHKVMWSLVLESVLGTFKTSVLKNKK